MNKKFLSSLVLLLILTRHIAAQSNGCITNPPDFGNLTYNDGSEAANTEENEISSNRKKVCPEYIANLTYEIQRPNLENDRRVLAVWLLGELRPTNQNSIEVLIQLVDLKATKFDPKTRIRRWSEHPAEQALIKIGQPAINPILSHLAIENDDVRRSLMCEALVSVYRSSNNIGLADAKKLAQQQIGKKLSEVQANLESAFKELEK